MKKCRKCDISFNGNISTCPLCFNELVGEKTLNVFPKLSVRKENLLFKILLFASFSVAVLFLFGEYTLTKKFSISKIVILGLISNYISLKFILNNYRNALKMMNKYFFRVLILLFIWFFMIKSLIITTYIIPISCMVILLFNSIILLVLRGSFFARFGRTVIMDCIVGIIPLVLVFFKLSTFPFLSYVCVILDLLIFMALLIFGRDSIVEELKKLFNF